jgi:hypothetical protein
VSPHDPEIVYICKEGYTINAWGLYNQCLLLSEKGDLMVRFLGLPCQPQ